MHVIIHRSFSKQFAKIPKHIKIQFRKRRDIFMENASDALLNNHPLTGNREGQWSFNVTGDWRVIYEFADFETVVFMKIGTHDSLYRK